MEERNVKKTPEEILEFANGLKLLVMNKIDLLFYELLPLCPLGLPIAYDRFLTLHNQMCYASFLLKEANRTNHVVNNEEAFNQIWIRTMYLQSSILAYDSCTDYIFSILYFYFDLYKKFGEPEIVKRQDIVDITCRMQHKISRINQCLSSRIDTKAFMEHFNTYREFSVELHNKANEIKHRGGYWVFGNSLQRITNVSRKIDGIDVNLSELLSHDVIQIEDEIIYLSRIHQSLFDLQKELVRLLRFETTVKETVNSQMSRDAE